MSSELLAVAPNDELWTIVDALLQWLFAERGTQILVDTQETLVLRCAATNSFWVLPLPLEPGDVYFEDIDSISFWYLVGRCLHDPAIGAAITNVILIHFHGDPTTSEELWITRLGDI
jgi:hypothetical protein